MTRGGREKEQDDPERKCIVSGDSQPKTGLVRFCIGPDNSVVPDILGRLPGRGIYVAADRAAITKAATKGLFSRAARQSVTVPPGLEVVPGSGTTTHGTFTIDDCEAVSRAMSNRGGGSAISVFLCPQMGFKLVAYGFEQPGRFIDQLRVHAGQQVSSNRISAAVGLMFQGDPLRCRD